MSLTNLCDSRCKTCDIWQIYPQKRLPLREELTDDEFKRLFPQLPSSIMWVSFSGGEPHLRKDFCDIMESAFSDIRNIAMVNVPNNGIKADRCIEDWQRLLAIRRRPFVYITMSLDGEGAVHDDVRGVDGNYESAVYAFEEIDALCKQHGNAAIRIGLTISKFNFDKIMPFVHNVIERGISLKIEAADSGDLYYQGQAVDERPDLNSDPCSWLTSLRQIHSGATLLTRLRAFRHARGSLCPDGKTWILRHFYRRGILTTKHPIWYLNPLRGHSAR